MNVTCPDCRSVFRVDPAKVPIGGVRARCSVCGGVIAVSAPEFGEATVAVALPSVTPIAEVVASVPEPMFESDAEAAPELTEEEMLPSAEPEPISASVPAPVPVPEPRVAVVPTPAFTPPAPPVVTPVARPEVPHVPPPMPAAPSGNTPRPFSPVGATPAMPARPVGAGITPARPPFAAPARPMFAPPVSPVAPARPTPLASPMIPPAMPASPAPRATQPRILAPFATPVTLVTPAVPTASVSAADAPPRRVINPFLANDPNQKAKRLARALVSDMVAYLPQKREEGLKNGTLKQLFREEIKKSYEEYVDQIGKEFAESTTHFQDALNDVLSGGKKMF